MLMTLLKRTALAFLVPLVLVLLVLILARPRWTVLQSIPTWVFFALIAAIVVIWVLVVVFQWMAQRKRAQAIEQGILKQAQWNVDNAAPARRAEIEEIKKSLGEAMATLQKGPDGRKALYSLPWYMIIGPPATGKTTAIVNSGLNFPNMTTAKRMRGAGGTRNCDWWFSTDAILLDTAGRYAQSADRSETEQEWFGFLDLLKKNRPKGPLNGLILAYSMETLVSADDNRLINDARELRQRMDEILDRLGWTFPVYVLVTKCDLVGGFADFFSSLSPADRQQVWGATLPVTTETDQKVAERVDKEVDLILQRLREVRTKRMAVLDHSDTWGKVFMFPEEFSAVRSRLHLFFETLFEPNPFRKDQPLFRGLYFSSGKQLGRPFELVVQKIQAMLGMAVSFVGGENQPEKEDAFFVRDLFAKVLKGDRDLVRRTSSSSNKWARVQLLTSIGVGIAAILACLFIGVRYSAIQFKMGSTLGKAKRVMAAGRGPSLNVETVSLLDELRRDLARGWNTFPLYVGQKVKDRGREVYLAAASERILVPVEERIADRLDEASNLNAHEVRTALQAELLLLRPDDRGKIHADEKHLGEALSIFGFPDIEATDPTHERLVDLADAFLDANKPLRDFEGRRGELRNGADRLADTHEPREYYEGMIAAANRLAQPLTVKELAGDELVLKGSSTVGAAFTNKGFEKGVKDALANVDETINRDNDLIRLAGGTASTTVPTRSALMQLYAGGFESEWTNFLEGIDLPRGLSCDDAEEKLKKLKGQNSSPLFRLFKSAGESVDFGLLTKILNATEVQPLETAAKPLKAFSEAPGKDLPPPAQAYNGLLSDAYRQVKACKEDKTPVDKGVVSAGVEWADEYADTYKNSSIATAMQSLLERPFVMTEAAGKTSGKANTNEGFKGEVVDFFGDKLNGKYPLGTGDPADINDIVKFFGPDGSYEASGKAAKDGGQTLSGEYEAKLGEVMEIRKSLGLSAAGARVAFTVETMGLRSTGDAGANSLQEIDAVTLTINGKSITDRLGDAKRESFTWTPDDADPTCTVEIQNTADNKSMGKASGDETLWSFFRLVDKARVSKQGNAWKVSWVFDEAGVAYDVLISMRSGAEPPFTRGSAFRSFRPPAKIVE